MEQLIAVERNRNGEIISFKTSTGRVISYRKAIQEIQEGIISGVELSYQEEQDLPSIVQITNDSVSFDHFPPIY